MRAKVRALYYPDFWIDSQTLKKALILFDELHFMDRPSMIFSRGKSQFGTIGAESPLRRYEASFRAEGIPFYVHNAASGALDGKRYEEVQSDIDHPEFIARYQKGLKSSQAFRNLQIQKGNYGAAGNQDDVAKTLSEVNYVAELKSFGPASLLLEDDKIQMFDLSNPLGQTKQLIANAMFCSAKMNFALGIAASEGFQPLADASPYGNLIGAKCMRASAALQAVTNKVQMTDLSFAIFDELISSERLKELDIKTVVQYRKASEKAREQFLDHLTAIQAKQSMIGAEGDYAGALNNIIITEIAPAITTFRNQLKTIDEKLVGSLVKGVVGAFGGSSTLNVVSSLSLPQILLLASSAAAYVAIKALDAIVAERALRRDCSISYILSLDDYGNSPISKAGLCG